MIKQASEGQKAPENPPLRGEQVPEQSSAQQGAERKRSIETQKQGTQLQQAEEQRADTLLDDQNQTPRITTLNEWLRAAGMNVEIRPFVPQEGKVKLGGFEQYDVYKDGKYINSPGVNPNLSREDFIKVIQNAYFNEHPKGTMDKLVNVGMAISEPFIKLWQKISEVWEGLQLKLAQNSLFRRFVNKNNPMIARLGEVLQTTGLTIVSAGKEAANSGYASVEELFTIYKVSIESKGISFEDFIQQVTAELLQKGEKVVSVNYLVTNARKIREKYARPPEPTTPAANQPTAPTPANQPPASSTAAK